MSCEKSKISSCGRLVRTIKKVHVNLSFGCHRIQAVDHLLWLWRWDFVLRSSKSFTAGDTSWCVLKLLGAWLFFMELTFLGMRVPLLVFILLIGWFRLELFFLVMRFQMSYHVKSYCKNYERGFSKMHYEKQSMDFLQIDQCKCTTQ